MITEEVYQQVADVVEKYGYKRTGDVLGSSFDKQGHITTIEPREMTTHYEDIISQHQEFTSSSAEVRLRPVDVICGSPQSDRLFRVVGINVQPETLDEYRGKLGSLKPFPHLSVFTQEIQAIPSLKTASIIDFTREVNGTASKELNAYLQGKKLNKYCDLKNFRNAVLVGLFALATSWVLYKKACS